MSGELADREEGRPGSVVPELVAAAAVAGSYLAVRSGRSDRFDVRVAVARRRGGSTVDRAMAHFTDLGSVYGIVGAAAVAAATGDRRLARDLAGAGSVAWVAAQQAKPLLNRQRPFETGTPRLVAIPVGTSWPSGHSAVSAGLATVIAGRSRGADRPVLTVLLALGLAGFVGGSRLHVGVHHPTDVVAGWGFGVLAARAWRRLVSAIR